MMLCCTFCRLVVQRFVVVVITPAVLPRRMIPVEDSVEVSVSAQDAAVDRWFSSSVSPAPFNPF